jgi:hypothetical protein
MAKDRVQVGSLPSAPRLQPRAQPVDTFHRPDEKLLPQGKSEMAQVAEALAEFQPTLHSVAVNMKNRDNLKQNTAGQVEAAARKLKTIKALGDAVRNGEIPAARNPAFLSGMRRQVARIEGEEYDRALREQYAQSNSRNENDITDFVGGFTKTYLEAIGADVNDPTIAAELLPRLEASQANLKNRHRAERDQAIEFEAEQNTDREIGLLLERMDETGASPEEYAGLIHGTVQIHLENGMSGTRANDVMAQAIARKARENRDTSYLDLFDNIDTGNGKLSQIGRIKDLRAETEDWIYRKIEEEDRISSHRVKTEREAAINGGLSEGFTRLVADPTADVTDVMLTLNQYDPESAQKLYSWQQAHISGVDNSVEDPHAVIQLTGKVLGGNGSLVELLDANRNGLISLNTAKELAGKIESSKDFRSPLRDPTLAELHKKLGAVIQKSDNGGSDLDIVNAAQAQNQFLDYVQRYRDKNPDADPIDVLAYGRKVQNELLETYNPIAMQGARDAVEWTPERALVAAPESIEWTQRPIFKPDQLKAAYAEFVASKGTSGLIVDIARRVGADPSVFYSQQARIVAKPPKTNSSE